MANALSHYHETFTNFKTGNKIIDTMHSAVYILRKDSKGSWKVSFQQWN